MTTLIADHLTNKQRIWFWFEQLDDAGADDKLLGTVEEVEEEAGVDDCELVFPALKLIF